MARVHRLSITLATSLLSHISVSSVSATSAFSPSFVTRPMSEIPPLPLDSRRKSRSGGDSALGSHDGRRGGAPPPFPGVGDDPSAPAPRHPHIPPGGGVGADGAPPTPAVPPPFTQSEGSLRRLHADDGSAYGDEVPDLSSRFGSIVLLEVSYVEPNYLRPWQKTAQGSCTGSGFAISGRRILTNQHVIQDATDIRVRKHGNARRWRARVVCNGPDVDLAVLEIFASDDDPDEVDSFWDGVKAVEWTTDGPPELQSSVNVVGYPTGGRTICVTEGVVSRVDCRNYRIKTAAAAAGNLLVIQIDAAINPGNSGGPCFDDEGRVVGVAFQGLEGSDAQNVGYIIPSGIVHNFLYAIECDESEREGEKKDVVESSGKEPLAKRYKYDGVQEVPFRWAPLQNKSLRKLLKMPKESTGVVVTRTSPLAEKRYKNFLKENDVITHIDGRSIGDDYTVSLRQDELMNADFLITGKRSGDPTVFDVIRDTKPLKISVTLAPLPANVPREHNVDCTPEWLVIGGLLFVPLTCPLLSYGSTEELEASGYLKIYDFIDEQVHQFRKEEGKESILLIDILACDTNFGYYFRQSWRVLDSLNGEKVTNTAHLYRLYAEACKKVQEGSNTVPAPSTERVEANADASAISTASGTDSSNFLIFRFKDKSRIVLGTAECMSSEKEVLAQHGIPTSVSSGIVNQAEK